MIDMRLDLYESFFDHAWAREVSGRVPPALDEAFDNLCLAWKEAANTHRLPWLLIEQLKGFAGGLLSNHKSHLARLVNGVKLKIVAELNGALIRADRKKVARFVEKIDRDLRVADARRDTSIPALAY